MEDLNSGLEKIYEIHDENNYIALIENYMDLGEFAVLLVCTLYVVAYKPLSQQSCTLAWDPTVGGHRIEKGHELSANTLEAATEWISAHKDNELQNLSPKKLDTY